MATNINMPRLGLTMTSGVIVKWLKAEGDVIKKGEGIVEVESDKSVVVYESPESGVLLKILVNEGDSCEIYMPMAIVGEEGESIENINDDEKILDTDKASSPISEESSQPKLVDLPLDSGDRRIFISPSARRIAKENNVDINNIPFPTGKKRIEKSDVLAFVNSNKVKATPLAAKMANEMGIELVSVSKGEGQRIYSQDLESHLAPTKKGENKFAVSGMRKVIATRMKSSLDTAAHVSLTTEIDMTKTIEMKNRVNDIVQSKYGVKLSVNDIVLKCVAKALIEYPRINSVFTDSEIIEKAEINIGVAVALDEGLIVPVIKDADLLSLGEIASKSKELVGKARQGKLLPDDYASGTFTVSNLGMYEITQFTSIINQPESAILSVAKSVERPVVVDGEVVIRSIMNLTISFDHRPIDGSLAAIFLRRLKQLLEEPYELIV